MASAYIERIERKYRGRRHPYYFLTVRKGKIRKRKYIPFREVLSVMEVLEMNRKKKHKLKQEKSFKEPMEKNFFPKPLRFLLKSAGYSVRGSELKRGRNFMSKSAANVRFEMLDRESQKFVRSPANLLRMNSEACSLLKYRNRWGIKTSYNDCMAEVCSVDRITVMPAVS